MERLVAIMEEIGLPFAYHHFAEGESPDPPFICFLTSGSDNFAADGRDYFKIDQVPFKASAAIPRIYRVKYGRDIFKDLMKLEKALNENAAEESNLDLFSLETFENIAYLMAKHADPSLPDTAEEWLDEFSVFSIYQVLPEIISLWGLNVQTQSVSKKNDPQPSEG